MLRRVSFRANRIGARSCDLVGKSIAFRRLRRFAPGFVPKRQPSLFSAGPVLATADAQPLHDKEPQLRYEVNRQSICIVNSFSTLEAMRRHVFIGKEDSQSTASGSGNNLSTTSSRQEPSRSTSANFQNSGASHPSYSSNGDLDLVDLDLDYTPAQNIVHSYSIVGLDAEWQPSGSFSPVAVLQLSTRSTAYLVDMMYFCRPAPSGWSNMSSPLPVLNRREAALDSFLSQLFAANSIVKAGFAFNGDLRNLCRSFPQLPCLGRQRVVPGSESASSSEEPLAITSFIDVKQLALRLWPNRAAVVEAMGLAKLTALILGKRLDKTYQVSDWGRRPLSQGQAQYAAADAHVLTALADRILSCSPDVQSGFRSFPNELSGVLDIATAAKEARLWHKVRPSAGQQIWSWDPLASALPQESFDPHKPRDIQKNRVLERTPRLATKAVDHGVNFAALEEFLGYNLPKKGRSVIMQIASTTADGKVPAAIPQYSRGGGIIAWRNSIMLFVNLSDTSTSTYANTFPEKGRKLVWFPGTGQTKQHPLIRRMLNICQGDTKKDRVLLFCRRGSDDRWWMPYVYLGQLGQAEVDWKQGRNGTFVWRLMDYKKLAGRPAFQDLMMHMERRGNDR